MLRRSLVCALRVHARTLSSPAVASATEDPLMGWVEELASKSKTARQSREWQEVSDRFVVHWMRIEPDKKEGAVKTLIDAAVFQKRDLNNLKAIEAWASSPEGLTLLSDELKGLKLKALLSALSAVVSLRLDSTPLCQQVLECIQKSSQLTDDVDISNLTGLIKAAKMAKFELPVWLKTVINDALILKTRCSSYLFRKWELSEVKKASELIAVLNYVSSSSTAWGSDVMTAIRRLIGSMTLTEAVSILSALVAQKQHSREVFRQREPFVLLENKIASHPEPLRVNNLLALFSVATLIPSLPPQFIAKLTRDVESNINLISSWSHLASIVTALARLRIADQKPWRCCSAWCRQHLKEASELELNMVVTAAASSGVRGFEEPAELLAQKLNVAAANSAHKWLNSVHSIAFFEKLTPQLAESVVRKEFLQEALKEATTLEARVYNATRIMQVNACALLEMNGYNGATIDYHTLSNYFNFADHKTKEAVLRVKYGKEMDHAERFRSLLHHVAPFKTHCTEDSLHVHGCIIEGQNGRFVKCSEWPKGVEPLSILFFGNNQIRGGGAYETMEVHAKVEVDWTMLLGQHQLAIRLLKKASQRPVVFYRPEIDAKTQVKDKIALIKVPVAFFNLEVAAARKASPGAIAVEHLGGNFRMVLGAKAAMNVRDVFRPQGVKRDVDGRPLILPRSSSQPLTRQPPPTDFSSLAGCSDDSDVDTNDDWIDNIDVSRFARDVAPKFASQPLPHTLSSLSPRCFHLSPPLRESSPNASASVHPKPNYSYSCLIALALKNSRFGQLTVSEIYTFMWFVSDNFSHNEHFPYFRTAPSGWKNSVRHNLSLNKCFMKVEVETGGASGRKSCLWMVNPDKRAKMEAEVKKWTDKDPHGIAKSLADLSDSRVPLARFPSAPLEVISLSPFIFLQKRTPLGPRNEKVNAPKLSNDAFKMAPSVPTGDVSWCRESGRARTPQPTAVVCDEPELLGVSSPPRTPRRSSSSPAFHLLHSPSPHYPSSFESVAHALSNNSLLVSAIAQSPYKGSALSFPHMLLCCSFVSDLQLINLFIGLQFALMEFLLLATVTRGECDALDFRGGKEMGSGDFPSHVQKFRVQRAPPSIFYVPEFVTTEEEERFVREVDSAPKPKWKTVDGRRVQNLGGVVGSRSLIPFDDIPLVMHSLLDRIETLGVFPQRPNHVLVNEYPPGAGIMAHTDGPAFYPLVSTLTLGSHTLLDFHRPITQSDGDRFLGSMLLERRSLVLITDDAYSNLMHGIAYRSEDDVRAENVFNWSGGPTTLQRGTRVSLTIRNVPRVSKHDVMSLVSKK